MKLTCPHCGQKGIDLKLLHGLGGADVFPHKCQFCHREAIRRRFSWQMLVAMLPLELAILAIFLPLHSDLKLALVGTGCLLSLVLRAVWVPFVPYSAPSTSPVIPPEEDEYW